MDRRRFLLQTTTAASTLLALRSGHAAIVDETWFDAARQRHLPLCLRWPDGDGPCALVLHSHGLGGSRDGGDAWGRAWRAAGFAVLHLQHPGSDTEVLRSGMVALRAAASVEQWRERVADMQFAIDELTRRVQQRAPGWSRVRLDAIGASGHSFGAQTVQALAGQRFAVAAERAADPRIKAFIAFSPSLARRLSPAEQFGAVTRPFLAITGSADGDPLGGSKTGDERARVYDGLPPGRRALLWLDGADHMSFSGNAEHRLVARWGPLKREPAAARDEALHHERIARITTLWWRAHLLGDAQALAALRAPTGLGTGDRWQQR